jgi:outer membrane biosynthesis protein TonB
MLYRLSFLLILLFFRIAFAQTPDSLYEYEYACIQPIEAQPVNFDSVRKLIIFPAEIKKEDLPLGMTLIRLLVDANGKVINHKVTKEVHPALTRELIRCYYYLRFIPARQGGKPVKSWVGIPYRFNIK